MSLDAVLDYKTKLLSLPLEQDVTHLRRLSEESTHKSNLHTVSVPSVVSAKLRAPDSIVAVGLSDRNGVDVETSFVLTVCASEDVCLQIICIYNYIV